MAEIASQPPPKLQLPTEMRTTLIGPIAVLLALLSALTTFLVFTGLIAVQPTDNLVIGLVLANVGLAVLLLGVIAWEAIGLYRARAVGRAGARLHIRVVMFFSVIATVPAILFAVASTITLERLLIPVFSGPLRELVLNSSVIAQGYQQQLCQNVGREMRLLAAGVEGVKEQGLYERDRAYFRDFLTARATVIGFPIAMIINRDGNILDRADINSAEQPPAPREQDFAEAETPTPPCLISRRFVGSLVKLPRFDGAFLYVARPVQEQALLFGQVAEAAIFQYQVLDAQKSNLIRAFVLMYALIALTLLLAAVWLGLSFANRLVTPIGRLIHASDQVAGGNLYVQVPVRGAEDDISHLGRTFNHMTAQLRQQQNRLMGASDIIDRRRRFMEAVLSGVSSAVIGCDAEGVVTVANPTAERLFAIASGRFVGRRLQDVVPELGRLHAEAVDGQHRLLQRQIELARDPNSLMLFVRVTSEQASQNVRGYVMTIDDITGLVTAQRTSAWADVARRIAHEIKNPLTPIQLSAERIQRKYGRVIVEDREIFDQCTATIVRQVDDIRRMVDEFSSFARMPKPAIEPEDLLDTLRQTLFLMRVGHPDITFTDEMPSQSVTVRFDRRLVGQAVQNVLKNAVEAVLAVPDLAEGEGRIHLRLDVTNGRVVIDITDNGKGFPTENRQRLLEPYVTSREGGTGLGLAIVAKIFEEHGGGIELLDNPEGKGAHVRLWFLDGFAHTDIQNPENRAHMRDQTT
jgi:two-component system nitrogen regulation sensor histidine kinase NtrY